MPPSKEKGFMTYTRKLPADQPVEERTTHWSEFSGEFDDKKIRDQAYRCMNCGVPFCMSGCPLGNIIPDFNDLMKARPWHGSIPRAIFRNSPAGSVPRPARRRAASGLPTPQSRSS